MSFDYTDEILDRMADLLKQGYSTSQIAKEISQQFGTHISRCAIIGKMRRLGWENPNGFAPRIRSTPVRTVARKPRLFIAARADLPKPEAIGPENDLGPGCQDIEGDPGLGEWRCCGQPRLGMSKYCEYHHAINYRREVMAS